MDRVSTLITHYLYNLELETATHSSILAWKIPWTEEPDRLQSMGSQRVGHDWVTEHAPLYHGKNTLKKWSQEITEACYSQPSMLSTPGSTCSPWSLRLLWLRMERVGKHEFVSGDGSLLVLWVASHPLDLWCILSALKLRRVSLV